MKTDRPPHDRLAGAPEIARAFTPDIVFLDIGLSAGVAGCEVARRLRANPDTADTVLVALTGWGSDDDKRTSYDAGFDFHLTKPVDADAVQVVLARFCTRLAGGRER